MNKKVLFVVAGIVVAVAATCIFAKQYFKVSKEEKYESADGGGDDSATEFVEGKTDDMEKSITYEMITMTEAKEIFETKGDYIILDVRTEDEFSQGHIPGAINIPNGSIKGEPKELKDKDQMIYIYCRSGNRSKQAAKKLVELGYTSIVEFGGILDWPGEIEK